MRRILVLGGYGGFGARLSRRLWSRGHLVLVAGRSREAAEAFCQTLPGAEAVVADRTKDLVPVLQAMRPELVIDAAGPFQGSGYNVPRACLAACIPYLDLADGRDFVVGIRAFEEAAKAAAIPVIAGASSVPALTGAVVRRLADGLDRVSRIDIALSASNRATAGGSVSRAILGYAGKRVPLIRGGRWTSAVCWQELRRIRLGLAGDRRPDMRWVALADVPDLALLPKRLPWVSAVTFRAGTEMALQTIGLWLASWPVRWGWVRSLVPLAGWLLPLQRLMWPLGSDRSGMIVTVTGSASGRALERSWTLVAEQGDGPEIPTLAAAILADRILAGSIAPGARDAGGELDLGDFEPDFRILSIRHDVSEWENLPSPHMRVIGAAFGRLPPTVSAMHRVVGDAGAAGRAVVVRGRHPLAHVVARLMRFPAEGEHDIHVHFSQRDGVETWTRDFSGRIFRSYFSEKDGRLVERFGPLRFVFDLPSDETGLRMVLKGWSAFGVPLPLALGPRGEAQEFEQDGLFRFDVPISLPVMGTVVRYRGWLRPLGRPVAPD
jgi:hypothetical protein